MFGFLGGESVEVLVVQAANLRDEGVRERFLGVEVVTSGEEVNSDIVARDQPVEHVVVELQLEKSRPEPRAFDIR